MNDPQHDVIPQEVRRRLCLFQCLGDRPECSPGYKDKEQIKTKLLVDREPRLYLQLVKNMFKTWSNLL